MLPDDKPNPSGTPDQGGEHGGAGDAAPEEGRAQTSPGVPSSFGSLRGPSDQAPAEGAPEGHPPVRSLREREVKVLNLYQYEERNELTFVLLQDGQGRKLPIWIGPDQAQAIYIALHKEQCDFHRPLTHDLLKNLVEKLGGKIERLTIDDMWQDTFYARLVLNVGDRSIDVDCRPSDGIAVALRAQAPIYVADEVLESCHLNED